MRIVARFAWALALMGLTACGSVEVATGGAGGAGGNGGAGAAAGSGGAGGTGGATATPSSAEPACEAHSAAVCAKELLCFPGREDVIGPLDTCTERMKIRCLSRVGQYGTGVTPETLTACAEAMSAEGCGVYTDFPAACQFTGSRQIDAQCTDGAQCQTGWCKKSMNSGCGTCADPGGTVEMCLWGCDAGPNGCSFEGTVCPYSKICNGGLCYPGPTEGEACGAFPYYCTYPSACIDGTCTLEVPQNCSI